MFEQSEKLLKKYANIDSKLSRCEDWFRGTTTYTVVSELISAKWKHKSSIHIGFIVFNGGVATFFAKSVFENLLLCDTD